MQSGLDIADSVIKHNQERAKSSLENARKDGHICYDSRWDALSVWHTIDSLMLHVDSVLFLQIQVHSYVS
jgi:hypothetical protein